MGMANLIYASENNTNRSSFLRTLVLQHTKRICELGQFCYLLDERIDQLKRNIDKANDEIQRLEKQVNPPIQSNSPRPSTKSRRSQNSHSDSSRASSKSDKSDPTTQSDLSRPLVLDEVLGSNSPQNPASSQHPPSSPFVSQMPASNGFSYPASSQHPPSSSFVSRMYVSHGFQYPIPSQYSLSSQILTSNNFSYPALSPFVSRMYVSNGSQYPVSSQHFPSTSFILREQGPMQHGFGSPSSYNFFGS